MANYLVTGGCGFIGSHLVESLLRDGHRVRILDDLSTGKRSNVPAHVEIIVGDVADSALVADAMEWMDGCFHLAAVASVERSIEDWVGCHRVNATGSIAVFDACRPRGVRPARPVIFASSAAIYGSPGRAPLVETTPPSPLSPYGVDKLGSELHGAVAARVFRVPVTGLRFFNVYGPRQDPKSPYSGVISIFARAIADGRPIRVFGDGRQSRDFVFVADVVSFLRAAMSTSSVDTPNFRVFNVSTGRSVTLLELADILGSETGREVVAIHEPSRESDIAHSLGDARQAREVLGLDARTSLRDGLQMTLAWMQREDAAG